jgi:enoyl-CoA hydratase
MLSEVISGLADSVGTKRSSMLAVNAAKRSFEFTEEMNLRDGYRFEQGQTAALATTEDTQETLAAFRDKRRPVFKRR